MAFDAIPAFDLAFKSVDARTHRDKVRVGEAEVDGSRCHSLEFLRVRTDEELEQ